MFLFLAAASVALAADPTAAGAPPPALEVITHDDGTVVATVHVDAPAAAVRELLADPVRCAELAPEVLSAESTPKGDCQVVKVTTEGAWSPFEYEALRCPTANGWKYELLRSDDITKLESEWKVTEAENGSIVEYRIHTEVGSYPQGMVNQGVRKSARATLLELVRRAVR